MQRKQDVTCFAGLCNKNNIFADRFLQVCLVYKIRTFIFRFYWNNSLTCWLCYIFPLVLASRCLLILSFLERLSQRRKSHIKYVANQFELQRKLRPARASRLRVTSITVLFRGKHFLFLFTFTPLECDASSERTQMHTCVRSPLFTQNSTEGGRRNKSNPHPYSFLASNFPSQTSPVTVHWCGVSFCTLPELHFRGSQSADGSKMENILQSGLKEKRTWIISQTYTYYTDYQTSWMAEMGRNRRLWHLLTCAVDNKWQLLWMQVIIIRLCIPAIHAGRPLKSCGALPDGRSARTDLVWVGSF